ncbi:iron-sulfur cluster repair di-iron protein [Halalkalibacter okhensis]|uniref:ScdA n=1 Tax=Halalkalibacter okhensis TaxID=333138 RepID=A0A0B0IFX9_9BACI|nr:iron-sulfur cluster repair di-iron protein [Halalkalibacter okhensis]KHF38954.1 ScdA [Halalkalibacter okhensis]
MNASFTRETKTGDIVTQFPKASQLFKEYKIDFCCGGNRPISEAINEQDLNEEEVLSRLNTLYSDTINQQDKLNNWEVAPYSQLIDYILTIHHTYLYNLLPELSTFVTKVYRVHGKTHPELEQVYQLFHTLKLELEHHLIQEEEKIFPKIKEYEKSHSLSYLKEVLKTIDTLEMEHETTGTILKKIREVTNDYKLPEGACNTYTLTYLKFEELESDLFEHIHLENNILFQRLAKEKV